MTKEELMKKRFKVIADYPGQSWEVGYILPCEEMAIKELTPTMIAFYEMYPHLFKPLAWWEERKIEDLPEYIIGMHKGEYHRVKCTQWISEVTYPHTLVNGIIYYAPYSKPITEEEYLQSINQPDGK